VKRAKKRLPWNPEILRWIDCAHWSVSLIPNQKSRTPKHGFWLMRGAQPATSSGARLFAGIPIPALLPVLLGQHRDKKCDICDFWMRDSQTLGMVSERKLIKQKQIAGAFDVAILTLPS
jgi:hypothetical protein